MCLVSQDYTIQGTIGPIDYTALKVRVENGHAMMGVVFISLFLLFGVNVVGFYHCREHSRLVWLQIEFLQTLTALTLLSKCNEELSSADFAKMIDLGTLLRLNFACLFISKDPVSQGKDNFQLFGYRDDSNLFWEGLKGPLNLALVALLFVTLASIAVR